MNTRSLDGRARDELGRLLPLPPRVPPADSPEGRLDAILTRYGLLPQEIDRIAEPHDNAEAHLLALQIASAREQAAERTRQHLLATAAERLTKMLATRKNAMPERMARHREAQMARVRRALAECHGRKAPAARKLDMHRNTFDKYLRLVQEQDAARPVPLCALCGQALPSLDVPEQP